MLLNVHTFLCTHVALMWAFVAFDVGFCCLWCQASSERHRKLMCLRGLCPCLGSWAVLRVLQVLPENLLVK